MLGCSESQSVHDDIVNLPNLSQDIAETQKTTIQKESPAPKSEEPTNAAKEEMPEDVLEIFEKIQKYLDEDDVENMAD